MEQSPRQFLKEQKELLETLKCEYEIENYDKCLKWTLKFGKHKGETFEDVYTFYPQYIIWATEKKMLPEHLVNCFKLKNRIQTVETLISKLFII